jgi:bacterioferritin-associated ferredoxin
MYVCVCNAITERQVRASVAAGASTLSDLQFDLGVATCCGCCADTARQYLPEDSSRAYEASVVMSGNITDTTPSHATMRRFPVHRIAKAA